MGYTDPCKSGVVTNIDTQARTHVPKPAVRIIGKTKLQGPDMSEDRAPRMEHAHIPDLQRLLSDAHPHLNCKKIRWSAIARKTQS